MRHCLPVIERELLVASRRRRTYWTRVGGAGVALIMGGHLAWVYSRVSAGPSAGRQIFFMLVQFAFLFCLFSGSGRVADSLSSEKRQGTMGFLFLTRLRGADIVMGKLLAASLELTYAVLATVPVLGLTVMLGGVRFLDFAWTVVALFNTLFFSLAAGLLVSAVSREERRAAQTAAGVAVVFGYVLPAMGEYLRAKTNFVELGLWLASLSPLQNVSLASVPTTTAAKFWLSFLTVHALAWLALALASWILPRSWQDRVAAAPADLSWRERWRLRFARSGARAVEIRERLLARNPYYWLAARTGSLTLETWFLVGVVVLLAAGTIFWFRLTIPVFIVLFMAAIVLHTILKMQICAASCDRLAQDKQSGALELVLSTPLAVERITEGQRLALRRQFGWPIMFTIALNFAMLLVVLYMREEDFVRDDAAARNCVALFGTGVLMLLIDAAALGWIGMWQAITAPNVSQARSRSLVLLLLVPWVILMILLTGIASRQPSGLGAMFFIVTWFLLGAGNSVVLGCFAREWVHRRLRSIVAERQLVKR